MPGPLQPFAGGASRVDLDGARDRGRGAAAARPRPPRPLATASSTRRGAVRPHVNIFVGRRQHPGRGGPRDAGAGGLRDRHPAGRQRRIARGRRCGSRRRHAEGWLAAVLADFDAFLLDHAACERKASASAMALRRALPGPARARRGLRRARAGGARPLRGGLAAPRRARPDAARPDTRSPYMERLSKEFRKGSDAYFLDRLLCAGIAEARGCERFGLVAGGAAGRRGPRVLPRDRARRGAPPGAVPACWRASTSTRRAVDATARRRSSRSRRGSSASCRCGRRCTEPDPVTRPSPVDGDSAPVTSKPVTQYLARHAEPESPAADALTGTFGHVLVDPGLRRGTEPLRHARLGAEGAEGRDAHRSSS